ncbi:MAG TPA: FAD-dependent tricarballylate dehydrogenase TcuA [Ktedonobacteraceae bacterium]|nr:FAD-dependent tricarballylate dehydrogenase TcuA [Ktedonobacteraceae bacterium]
MQHEYDVVIVGSGNAALSAALAARERVERVLVLEKAPQEWRGGNSYFTAGAFRLTFEHLDDLRPLLSDFTDEDAAEIDVSPYTKSHFLADMQRITQGRCDPELTAVLVNEATETAYWLGSKGLRWTLLSTRQAFRVEGRLRFWGGLVVGTVGGGQGLVEQQFAAVSARGIEVRYNTAVVDLLHHNGRSVSGVVCLRGQQREEILAPSVILACGGFEADPRLRAMYLGPQWDLAKVRGTPYNTGDGLQMALSLGAQAYGHWSGCHATAWDAAAPPTGDRVLTNLLTKQSYPLGIVVNNEARRFVDEGADFRNYTYAKYGAEILRQPNAIAYQLFDAKTEPLLRQDEYTAAGVSRFEAPTIQTLAEKLSLNAAALERTVAEFNAAIQPGSFNPAIKDGKHTKGLSPAKSNWALPLDTPPFYGFAVTCGITFTFGGLHVDTAGRVLDRDNHAINGLYAAGELVGGLFYHNYPGGSGLMAGAVLGRRAGASAASYAQTHSGITINHP